MRRVAAVRQQNGNGPLHLAIEAGDCEMVNYLLMVLEMDVSVVNQVRCCLVSVVNWRVCVSIGWVESRVRVRVRVGLTQMGSSALLTAVASGHSDIVRVLCEFGADPSFQNKAGTSGMHLAASHGDMELLPLLVEEVGAVVDPRNQVRLSGRG